MLSICITLGYASLGCTLDETYHAQATGLQITRLFPVILTMYL